MKPSSVFSAKAEKYARYRWKYSPDCISTIIEVTHLSKESVLADIGAGTGILTREFVDVVGKIYAVEPNAAMRTILAREVLHSPVCEVVDGHAEATRLPGKSIDLVTVAQAIHWFDPVPTRKEIHRILKPGGWLAICRNYGTDPTLWEALSDVYPVETDTEGLMIGKSKPTSYYFCGDDYIRREFRFRFQVGWREFLGGLGSASNAPDEDSDRYAEFERRARQVFDRFSSNGLLEQNGITELYLGQIQCG